MDGNEFAVKHFNVWLDDVENLYSVELLELFGWEQGHGNWLASTQMEFDLAWQDLITPFNCRELLVVLLSIDKRYRISPDYRVFVALIENMWPELLQEPINPDDKHTESRLSKAGRRVKKAIKKQLVFFRSVVKL